MAREGRLGWVLGRAFQYLRIKLSYTLGRPLAGPVFGILHTNYTCNFRCRMCDMPNRDKTMKDRGLVEFSTEQMKSLLDDFNALGTPGISFTGGEPLLRHDIFELLGHSKKLGMITHLNTNGFLLEGSRIEAMFNSKVDSLNISLDGASPATHDTRRGCPGAFDRVVTALSDIVSERQRRGATLRIKIVTVLDEDNLDEVPAIVELVRSLGADCLEFIPRQEFSSKPERKNQPNAGTLEKLRFAVSYIRGVGGIVVENSPEHLGLFESSFKGEPSPLRCYAGYNSLGADCYGEVFPCVPWMNWGRSCGNVRNQAGGLAGLWRSQAYKETRSQVAQCRACYLNCQSELNLLFNSRGLRKQLVSPLVSG